MQEENLHVTLQTACSEALMNVTQQGSSTSGIEQDFALNKRDTFQNGTTAGTRDCCCSTDEHSAWLVDSGNHLLSVASLQEEAAV